MDWVKNAQTILEILPRPRKIFIASDNNEIIKTFLAFFGKETVSVRLFSYCSIYSKELHCYSCIRCGSNFSLV